MGLFDFFKKKKPEPEIEPEKVSLNNFKDFIRIQKKQNKIQEEKTLLEVRSKIKEFSINLSEKLGVLEDIDVNSLKAEDRFKAIVIKNLNNYIRYVKDTLERLENLKFDNLSKTTKKIDQIFLDFNKNSNISYHKATILIGKEMAQTKETIKNLSSNLINIFKENQSLIDKSKVIFSIEVVSQEIDNLNHTIDITNKKIDSFDSKIKQNQESITKINEKIESIKKSEEYLDGLNKKEMIRSEKEELKKEAYKLKELIDFKALSNVHHISEKEMKIIKAHKENFQSEIIKDNGEDILRLLKEAGINNEKIGDQINKINNKKQEIENLEKDIKGDQISELNTEIDKIKLENQSLSDEKIKTQKKLEKLEENKKEIINSLRNKLVKINVILTGD